MNAAGTTWELTPDSWVGIAGLVLGFFGLLVTIYTLSRVAKVQKAQEEATAFTQELLNIDQLEVDLVRVMARLRASSEPESVALGSEIGVTLGSIQGVRRALSSPQDRHGVVKKTDHCVPVESDFFGEKFISEAIKSAKQKIDIITGRTKLVSGYYVLDCIRQACERGVDVRLIGLSDGAPDEILNDAVKTVSNPAPRDAEDYRRQIRENSAEIVASVGAWSEAAQEHFQYRLNKSVPRVSMVRRDNEVLLGFLQFYRDAQPLELKDREYIRIPISLTLGRVALQHFDLVWNDSEIILSGVLAKQVAGTAP